MKTIIMITSLLFSMTAFGNQQYEYANILDIDTGAQFPVTSILVTYERKCNQEVRGYFLTPKNEMGTRYLAIVVNTTSDYCKMHELPIVVESGLINLFEDEAVTILPWDSSNTDDSSMSGASIENFSDLR